MKAAVCHAFGEDLVIEDVALSAPQEGQVEVKIAAVAICHSDIAYMKGAWGGTLPAVYGHEAAGVVQSVGKGVKGYKPGDRVIVTLIHSCGACPNCIDSAPALCEVPVDRDNGPLKTLDGGTLHHGMQTGAFAERVVVGQSQIVAIPDDISMDVASLLACGVITGVGAALNTAKIRAGSTVVVIGAGGVGLNAIQGARIAGAAKIIAVDLSAEKLEAAKEFGATHGVIGNKKPFSEVFKINGGRGADYVLVAVGSPKAYQTAPNYLRKGGMMVMVGMTPSGEPVTYEPVNAAGGGVKMIGSNMGDTVLGRDIPFLIELYRQGRLKLDALITGRYRLEDINAAVADTLAGKARRNVILFDD